MKAFAMLLALMISTISFAQSDVNCQTVGAASCLTEEGMCIEFIASDDADPDMWMGMCSSFGGEYAENPCDMSKVVMTCLNPNNMVMPITRFMDGFDLETANQFCTMMGGQVCK